MMAFEDNFANDRYSIEIMMSDAALKKHFTLKSEPSLSAVNPGVGGYDVSATKAQVNFERSCQVPDAA
jgi:hypothetical protein